MTRSHEPNYDLSLPSPLLEFFPLINFNFVIQILNCEVSRLHRLNIAHRLSIVCADLLPISN